MRKFTQTCKYLRTDAFKLHIYIYLHKKGAPPCAGKLYQLMSKKNVFKAFLKSRSIVNMTVMYRQYPPPGIPRAFDTFAAPGRREFNYQSLPGGGEFDPHALGGGRGGGANLNCTLDFM